MKSSDSTVSQLGLYYVNREIPTQVEEIVNSLFGKYQLLQVMCKNVTNIKRHPHLRQLKSTGTKRKTKDLSIRALPRTYVILNYLFYT